MRNSTIVTTLVIAATLFACGGPDQTASRTVEVGGNRYELVASFPTDVDQGEVDRLLSRVVLVHRAQPQPVVRSLIEIDVIAHDEKAQKLFAAVPGVSGESDEDVPDIIPLTEEPPPIRPTEIKGATDPDVDPASPY